MTIVRIIPEQHLWDKNIATRVDYVSECRGYAEQIYEDLKQQADLLNPETDKLVIIYMGDIMHRDFTDLNAFLQWLGYFMKLYDLCDGNLYSVVGNHEITYSHNNLFWMIADVQSKWVAERSAKLLKLNLLAPLIKVVDELLIDDTLFVFGHYGRDLSEYTEESIPASVKNVFLLSHNQILNSTIAEHFKKNCGRDMLAQFMQYSPLEKVGIIPRTSRLKHVYVGHMHRAYGDFCYEAEVGGIQYQLVLHYLASIGRTNTGEISDDFCERSIPRIIIEDGFVSVDDKKLQLVARGVVVSEETLIKRRETYGAAKEVKAITNLHFDVRDPVTDIRRKLRGTPKYSEVFEAALRNSIPEDITNGITDTDALLSQYGLVSR